jgi:hypothetical protein
VPTSWESPSSTRCIWTTRRTAPPEITSLMIARANPQDRPRRGRLWARLRNNCLDEWNQPTAGARLPREAFCTDQSAELLARTHFAESPVDLLVYHTLRLDSLFADGLCSLRWAAAAAGVVPYARRTEA